MDPDITSTKMAGSDNADELKKGWEVWKAGKSAYIRKENKLISAMCSFNEDELHSQKTARRDFGVITWINTDISQIVMGKWTRMNTLKM